MSVESDAFQRFSRPYTVDHSPRMEREYHTRSFGEGSHKLLRFLGSSRQTAVQARRSADGA
jgi:hypothetical protein